MGTKKKELRMYGLVPYQLTGIQQGIQHGHGVVEYASKHGNTAEYKDWAKNWKTFIILNGGTTNMSRSRPGSMNKHLHALKLLGVKLAEFHEPDLGDQLTAVVFILDERIFNKEKYPNFMSWVEQTDPLRVRTEKYNYRKWVQFIGGEKNVKIRDLISKFRLA